MRWQPHWGFYSGQWMVYVATLATVGVGRLIHKRRNFPTVVLATLLSSVVFFLLTNLVWVFSDAPYYPKTLEGQILSYTAALPFFQRTVIGDLFYSGCLFGCLALAEAVAPSLREQMAREQEPAGTASELDA
jgi:hypothetical protein